MTREALSDEQKLLAAAFIAGHHAITVPTPLADVVTGCACTPGVQRDSTEWASHLLAEILALQESLTASDASVSVGHGPVEEAGPCRVIAINRNTQ